jgi:hypothetical protein
MTATAPDTDATGRRRWQDGRQPARFGRRTEARPPIHHVHDRIAEHVGKPRHGGGVRGANAVSFTGSAIASVPGCSTD